MTHFAHSVPAGPHFHRLGGPQGNALLRNAKSALRASIKQKELGTSDVAMRAIFGSLTGALAFRVSNWITQRHQNRRDMLAKRMSLSTLLTDLPLR